MTDKIICEACGQKVRSKDFDVHKAKYCQGSAKTTTEKHVSKFSDLDILDGIRNDRS